MVTSWPIWLCISVVVIFCEYSWEQIELCWVALRGYRGVNVSDNYLFIEAVLYRNGAISALFR